MESLNDGLKTNKYYFCLEQKRFYSCFTPDGQNDEELVSARAMTATLCHLCSRSFIG